MKKIPLWKYIQSDFANKNGSSSSSSVINNKQNKKRIIKIPVANKIIKDSKQKGINNKSINSIIKNNFTNNEKNQKKRMEKD